MYFFEYSFELTYPDLNLFWKTEKFWLDHLRNVEISRMKWKQKWKKWKSTKFFGIVEYGVVNDFEKLLYEKWTKSHSDMEIWSIEKNPGFEPKGKGLTMLCWIRTQKCFPNLNWTYSEELVDPLNLEVWAYSEDLKSTLWEMFWTHFQDPAPPYTNSEPISGILVYRYFFPQPLHSLRFTHFFSLFFRPTPTIARRFSAIVFNFAVTEKPTPVWNGIFWTQGLLPDFFLKMRCTKFLCLKDVAVLWGALRHAWVVGTDSIWEMTPMSLSTCICSCAFIAFPPTTTPR